MPASNPEQMHQLFSEAFNAGNLDALLELYEPGAGFSPEPGVLLEGTEAISEALSGFLALKGQINLETKSVFQTGDIAFIHGQWTLDGTGADGNPVSLSGNTSEIARRQSDGSWLYVIDIPDDV